MEITVKNGQSIFDIALKTSGSIEAVLDLAVENDLKITDDMVAGTTLNYKSKPGNKVIEYYQVNEINPATAITQEQSFIPTGIDFWSILYDFEIQ